MDTRHIIAWALILAVVGTIAAVRVLTLRARRRERRQAARPIDILADTHDR